MKKNLTVKFVIVDNQFIESVFGKTMFSDVYFRLDNYLATNYFKGLIGYSIHINKLQIGRTFTIQDTGASCFSADHFYSPRFTLFKDRKPSRRNIQCVLFHFAT